MIRRTILTTLLALTAFAGGSTAFAGDSTVSSRGTTASQLQPDQLLPELAESDIEIIRNIVRVELTDKESGTEVRWRNSETGNSGMVILRDISVAEGMECREVTHILRMAGESDTQAYNLSYCLQSDGTWMYLF